MELGIERELKSIAITAFRKSPVAELADYVLLNLVTNQECIETRRADKPEIIMAEYKY